MRKTLFAAALAALALCVGCAGPYADHVTGPGVDDVTVMDVRTIREPNSLSAQVTLRNDDSDPLRLRYRFTWLDAAGLAVGVGTPTDAWVSESLAPYEIRYLRATAPNGDCADFRLYLQTLD